MPGPTIPSKVSFIIIVLLGFWPMFVLSHPAGDLYQQALSAIQDKHLQHAESLLEQAITEFPSYAEAHHLLGMVQYQRAQDPTIAILALKQAVKLNPNFAQAHYDLGLLLLKQEQTDEAQEQLQHTLTLYPGFWKARLTLGKMYDQRGETDRAVQEYEAVLTQQPSASEALYLLAYHLEVIIIVCPVSNSRSRNACFTGCIHAVARCNKSCRSSISVFYRVFICHMGAFACRGSSV